MNADFYALIRDIIFAQVLIIPLAVVVHPKQLIAREMIFALMILIFHTITLNTGLALKKNIVDLIYF
jgi:hypothetical protein